MSENKDNKLTLINEKTANDYLTHTWDVIKSILFSEYDIIFIDECSTIDNQTMKVFLEKLSPDTFLVLAGAIYQIESIDFGNWFFTQKILSKHADLRSNCSIRGGQTINR